MVPWLLDVRRLVHQFLFAVETCGLPTCLIVYQVHTAQRFLELEGKMIEVGVGDRSPFFSDADLFFRSRNSIVPLRISSSINTSTSSASSILKWIAELEVVVMLKGIKVKHHLSKPLRVEMMLMLKLYWPMASNNDDNTFRGLICIVDVGNIHKDAEFPIPSLKHRKLASLSLVEVPTNGMMLASRFHKTYDGYWWFIYRGTYGWDPQMLPADRELYRGDRKPRKIKHRTTKAQLQDLQAIISFFHAFGTTKYFYVIQDVVGRPPPQKRTRRGQEGSRNCTRSSGHDEDEDEDGDTETDNDTGLDSDDEFIVAHKEEMKDAKQCNTSEQMMMIWLANCWSIQVGQHDTSAFPR
ncbi:hypothetical protein F5146DRAFT_998751 [Armillaria mellea]|nr:hypothetical protein F5146DRAFT_998751 [Armillaria mellea]